MWKGVGGWERVSRCWKEALLLMMLSRLKEACSRKKNVKIELSPESGCWCSWTLAPCQLICCSELGRAAAAANCRRISLATGRTNEAKVDSPQALWHRPLLNPVITFGASFRYCSISTPVSSTNPAPISLLPRTPFPHLTSPPNRLKKTTAPSF